MSRAPRIGAILYFLACGTICGTVAGQTNPVPSLTQISPSTAGVGGPAFMMTLFGTGFSGDSIVQWNGSFRGTDFDPSYPDELTGFITAADIANVGTAQVTVFNVAPGGGTSNALTFTIVTPNPVPSLTSISPSTADAGGPAFTMTLIGTNFGGNSIVQWNGSFRGTDFDPSHPNELTGFITATDIANAGTAKVTVFNVAPGGGTSNAITFTVHKAGTSTSVVSSANPSEFGQSVMFTATVAVVAPGSGAPTGTVTFKNGTTVLGSGKLSSGKTTFSTSALTEGTHSITATYNGSTDYSTSTSPILKQTINPGVVALVTATAGSGQSATISTAFATALQATVQDSSGNLLAGVTVTFTAPASGASGTFANGKATTTAITNSSGVAMASTFTASSTAGSYSITASVAGVGSKAGFELTNNPVVQISSLSETTANSFDSLTITGTGFAEGTLAISVLFIPENGDPSVMIPVSASDSGSIQVMVPTFIGLGSATFAAEIVDVQVVQFSSSTTFLSNRIAGLQINTLPSVPDGVPVGAMTAALLSSTLNISEATLTAQTGDTTFSNTAAILIQFDTDLAPLISAVSAITSDPTKTVTLTTANGITTTLNAQKLALSDQLAQALIAAIVNQGSIPTASSSSNCPTPTGNTVYDSNLCSLQIYFQTLAGQVSASPASQRSRQATKLTLTPPENAVVGIYANLMVGAIVDAIFPQAIVFQLVINPIVTEVAVDLALNHDTPPGTEIAQGVGLNFLDAAFFHGTPVLATAAREIIAFNTLISWSPPPTGILLSSGAAGFVTGGVTFLDPNTGAPTTLLKVPVQTQGGAFDTTKLVIPSQPTPYTLTLSTAGSGSGSINSFPTGASFPVGTIVGLTAVPATGSTFAGWGGSGCSGTGMCSVTMNQNQTVTATFNTSGTPSVTIASATCNVVEPGSPPEVSVSASGSATGPAGAILNIYTYTTSDTISCGSWSNTSGITLQCTNNSGQTASTSWQSLSGTFFASTVADMEASLTNSVGTLIAPVVQVPLTCQ